LDYTYNDNAAAPSKSGLVQVGQKWDIADGFGPKVNNNDILDDAIADPINVHRSQLRSAEDMKYMEDFAKLNQAV